MKPAWDKLADAYKDAGGVTIADVDCTSDGGRSVCHAHGVGGYPTIKYYSQDTGMSGETYSGQRSFEALDSFVKENLAKYCDPKTLSLCDDQEKNYVEKQAGKDIPKLTSELDRLKTLLAAGVKDGGKSKTWIVKRIKILEALIGPTYMEQVNRLWGRVYFRTTAAFNRWAMGLAETLAPSIEAAAKQVAEWYTTVSTKVMGTSKGEL
eukprot:TRINITY_DN27899_c0_g1_i2.p1 TRINITY_DN27899_c0_g1~~TRINITY_DN27899_c0_g1_i2.p1  ORF type:complete len:208 (-),score=38.88 TRINITY_DN27899_c0_g1_i2:29-652(-)